MEQDRKLRNKPMHLWKAKLEQRRQDYPMLENSFVNKWHWENWTATCKKKENEIRSFFNNIHNISTQIIKNLEDWKP